MVVKELSHVTTYCSSRKPLPLSLSFRVPKGGGMVLAFEWLDLTLHTLCSNTRPPLAEPTCTSVTWHTRNIQHNVLSWDADKKDHL